jgi:uncharacterized membrane protein YdbT with pleckstrin-like domain
VSQPPIHFTEDAAALPHATRLGANALFTTHILRDGEVIILILKPSLWFIPFQAALFSAVVLLLACLCSLADGRIERSDRFFFEAAVLLISARVMWAVLQWMGRLYILTDQRVLRLSGVLNTDIFDCPLRKVALARRTTTFRERMLGLGSVEIYPCDDERLPASWQTVARPREVHAQIVAAIKRAKQC